MGKEGQAFVAEASSRVTRSNLFYSRVFPQFTPGSVVCCSQDILVRATAGSCREGTLIVQPRSLGSKLIYIGRRGFFWGHPRTGAAINLKAAMRQVTKTKQKMTHEVLHGGVC